MKKGKVLQIIEDHKPEIEVPGLVFQRSGLRSDVSIIVEGTSIHAIKSASSVLKAKREFNRTMKSVGWTASMIRRQIFKAQCQARYAEFEAELKQITGLEAIPKDVLGRMDIVKMEKVLKVPENKSIRQHILDTYGTRAMKLLRRML